MTKSCYFLEFPKPIILAVLEWNTGISWPITSFVSSLMIHQYAVVHHFVTFFHSSSPRRHRARRHRASRCARRRCRRRRCARCCCCSPMPGFPRDQCTQNVE